MLHRSTFLLLLLSACTGEKPDTGESSVDDSSSADDSSATGDEVTVSDVAYGGCAGERRPDPPSVTDTAEPESLAVTATGGGAVHVEHNHVADDCCLEHTVTASTSGTTLNISYPSSGEPCDCVCSYDYSFNVSGLAAGAWTVNAAGSSTTVTVD